MALSGWHQPVRIHIQLPVGPPHGPALEYRQVAEENGRGEQRGAENIDQRADNRMVCSAALKAFARSNNSAAGPR